MGTGCALASSCLVASTSYWSSSTFIIGLEDVNALQLLIEHSQWLELLCLDHLFLEPIFDLVLFFFFNFFVYIVEMSIQLW